LNEGEIQCGYCRRPWFGPVDFCPYCGRTPSFAVRMRMEHAPVLEQNIAVERDVTGPVPPSPAASPLLSKLVPAGVIALVLLWGVVQLLSLHTGEEASNHVPAATATLAVAQPRAPPQTSTSPCSAAHQAAGLCTSP
jgi:hypothetical protein